MKKIESNTETITIEQKLSVEELENASQKLADTVKQIESVKLEKADVAKSYGEQIKSLESISSIYADEVKTAIRKTQVNVTRRQNTNENVWEFVDEETGEIVKRKPYLLPAAPLFDILEDEQTEAVEVDEEEPELV